MCQESGVLAWIVLNIDFRHMTIIKLLIYIYISIMSTYPLVCIPGPIL